MQQLFENLSKKQKIGFMTVIFVVFVIIIISIIAIINKAEPIAKIRNLNEYMTTATVEEEYFLQRQLYLFLQNSHDTKINDLDIYIREGSFVETEANGANITDFIIDIDKLKISYTVSYVFPIDKTTSENPIFNCPAVEDVKYTDTKCVGMYNSSDELNAEAKNPISAVLPISVDKYDFGKRQAIRYDIFGNYDEENGKFSVRIIDYGGSSYEDALATIREKGFNPNDYDIEYVSYGN